MKSQEEIGGRKNIYLDLKNENSFLINKLDVMEMQLHIKQLHI